MNDQASNIGEPPDWPMARPSPTDIINLAAELANRFAERAAAHDADHSFPYENYTDIRASGYPALTVPVELGGWGASLLQAVQAQERLAMGDGSTALSIAMHVQTIGAAAAGEKWNPHLFERLAHEVIERGALVNSCATEPDMGSPSRGGRPATHAYRQGDDWIVNGRKSFASMSPALDYFVIPAYLDGEDMVARFLIPRQDAIEIVETWDSLGMRSTGSHDVVLHDVHVPADHLIQASPVGFPDPNRNTQNAWFVLLTSAVYLGVAGAAHQTALTFAHERIPTALGKPIATLESIQRRLGEAELALQVARTVLYYTADQWDRWPEQRSDMANAITIAKLTVTNKAIEVVDHAMRAVGGSSMTRTLPLERYFRDVRAGLFHPPNDDSALPLLGRVALQRIKPLPSSK